LGVGAAGVPLAEALAVGQIVSIALGDVADHPARPGA
jgi:hypothetical protein